MNNNYILLDKSKIKAGAFCLLSTAVIVCGFVIVYFSEPFLGFGVHNFTDQLLRLTAQILIPLIIMTATDYLAVKLFGKRKIAYTVNAVEAVIFCGKYCYSVLCAIDMELFGFSEPAAIVAVIVALHLLFWLAVLVLQIFVIAKMVCGRLIQK